MSQALHLGMKRKYLEFEKYIFIDYTKCNITADKGDDSAIHH